MRTGLTAYDPNLACSGYLLYGPIRGRTVHLIDIQGREVHRWDSDLIAGLWGYLQPNGNLFRMGRGPDELGEMFPGWTRYRGGVMQELDWRGKVVWEYRDPYQHHDARRTASGGVIYLGVEPIPDEIAKRIRGGRKEPGPTGMWADLVVEVNSAGQRVWEWHAYEHLDPEEDELVPESRRYEWTHCNTVVELDADHVMISCRDISVVAIIQKSSGRVTWRVGREVLAQQHDCSELASGNILVFSNGIFKATGRPPFSSVLEIDRRTGSLVWEYTDQLVDNLYSSRISGARRLANGNTLVTEGGPGRMFQVTAAKEVVWEYINPHYCADEMSPDTNSVFRAEHYSEETIAPLLQAR